MRPLSQEINAKYYKAPEVLLGSKTYDSKIDIWAAGCILAELIQLAPLFPGNNDIELIVLIFEMLGTPTSEELLDESKWS